MVQFVFVSRRELHEKAFRRLGGTTTIVVLDNLREGVLAADIYDPQLNPLYRDVLADYGVTALPYKERESLPTFGICDCAMITSLQTPGSEAETSSFLRPRAEGCKGNNGLRGFVGRQSDVNISRFSRIYQRLDITLQGREW